MDEPLLNSRIRLRHLQCFLAVTHLGGLQRAAEKLSITQPAVSKTIGELESILGHRLFERSRKGAALTNEGRLFLPYANASLSSLHEGMSTLLREGRSAPVVVKLGILPTLSAALLPQVLTQVHHAWPSASVRVTTAANADLLDRLRSAELDFVIGRLAEPEAMSGMSFEHLFHEPLTAVIRSGHPLHNVAQACSSQLAQFLLVVPPAGTLIRQSADSVMAAFGLPPDVALIETLSMTLGRALVIHNDAVWFVPYSVVEEDIAHGVISPLQLPFAGTDEPIGLIWNSAIAPLSAAATLIEEIRNTGRQRNRARAGLRYGSIPYHASPSSPQART
jgi:LysR family pca operon transcriptional activator